MKLFRAGKSLSAGLVLLLLFTGCMGRSEKNIARLRAVYQSGAADFNATGQLATDGILTVNKHTGASQNEVLDSRWISPSNSNEWLYIDLGVVSRVNAVKLCWDAGNFASRYEIRVSDDAESWRTVFSKSDGAGGEELCRIKGVKARYVRLNCIEGGGENFALVEMEVLGRNNLVYTTFPQPEPLADGSQYLRDGNWKLERASEVGTEDGTVISSAGFDDSDWLPATVPGTVLTSYLRAGAIPDPNYGEQQRAVSDSYFTADFWYRNHFEIPVPREGEEVWLNFNAVNWKAEVFFNGNYLGRIDGAFIRGRFEIGEYVNRGGENHLAVLVHKNDTQGDVTIQTKEIAGPNGGALGADNPTIHASVGWDWLPTIRGRNIGIYDDVFISRTREVQLIDPWVSVDLDTEGMDFSKATLTVKTELGNFSKAKQSVVVKGRISPSGLEFQSPAFTLEPGETREVTVAEVIMENPNLWWPNTYGEQFLYDMELAACIGDVDSDSLGFRFGVREFTYSTEKQLLTIYCNGTRIICRGGNWGMDDGNLAATEDEYDIKVRMHAEANLTMIRNWVGMTRKDAFYRACDKYGILVWDDFWLANPNDGPEPDNEWMFMKNAVDKVKRNRHYTSIVLYCGRNEGNPPESLDKALAVCTEELDGTRPYISHSADGMVSGFGPYAVREREWYFENTPSTLHSERGMPNIPAYESLARMLPPENRWPIDDVWGIHDFTMKGAQNGEMFLEQMNRYGAYNSLEKFSRTAQMVNYIGHKAIFEAVYAGDGNGMLMWMSQSAWPSMVWQTYDYYYDTNAGYFAVKQANQPVNLIYNPATHAFLLTNYGRDDKKELTATIRLFDLNGKTIREDTFVKPAPAGSATVVSELDFSELSGIIFIKSEIHENGRVIADNFTWTDAGREDDYRRLSELPKAKLQATCRGVENGKYKVTVVNEGDSPALMIRIKTLDSGSGEQILPVWYSDNYFSLMPGESKEINVETDDKSMDAERINFGMEGWNVSTMMID